MIKKSFNTDINFWEVYPELKNLNELSAIYSEDNSVKKQESSQLLWAFTLICHPDSMWFNIPDKDTRIVTDFLKKQSPPKNFQELKLLFTDICLSPAQRNLYDWGERLRKRRLYLDQQDYNLETAEDLDKAHSRTPKLYQEYEQIKKQYEEEKSKAQGNKVTSLSESNDI